MDRGCFGVVGAGASNLPFVAGSKASTRAGLEGLTRATCRAPTNVARQITVISLLLAMVQIHPRAQKKAMDTAAARPDGVEVIFSPEVIMERLHALAGEIVAAKYDRLLVIPILTGSFVFSADLLRVMHQAGIAPEVDFLSLASYRRGTKSSGSVDILRDMELDVAGRDVLLVDDILDTGRTLAYAKDLIAARGARRIGTCVLLNKRVRRAVDIDADFVAFECPPVFVVGYGMDLAHRYRELPFVGRVAGSL